MATLHAVRPNDIRVQRREHTFDIASIETVVEVLEKFFFVGHLCSSHDYSVGYYEAMLGHSYFKTLALMITASTMTQQMAAAPVPVRYPEGLIHGFLALRDVQNNILASGDLSQTTNGSRVTAELVFHFKDGSLHQETAVYSQRRTFQLLTYHLIQKGPAFKKAVDFSIDVAKGLATVHATEDNGKEKTFNEHMKLPADLANGLLTTLLLDIDPSATMTNLSMVVATPKPRLVKLEVMPGGEDSFSFGGVARKAFRYTIKIDIGGISGVVAPLVGKQPSDLQVWILSGKAPGFLRLDGQLFEGGPIWRIELASPAWPEKQ
jgi:hypothetical protein